jgi:glycosyltransferase involved in cell wall biosynthesis
VEYIIINDASDDDTSDILSRCSRKDKRITIITNAKNLGLTKSLNLGIGASKGEYIARQDADDVSHPERLAKQIEYLTRNKDVMMLGTGGHLMDESGNVLRREHVVTGKNRLKKRLWKRNQFIHGSVVIRRSCLNDVGLYNEEFKSAQDYDLFLRISEKYAVDNLPDPLYSYRLNPTAISSTKSREQQIAALIARMASVRRRKGVQKEWVPGTYEEYKKDLDTIYWKRIVEHSVRMTSGRNSLLEGNVKNAREEFLKAFIAFPSSRPVYHFLRTFAKK